MMPDVAAYLAARGCGTLHVDFFLGQLPATPYAAAAIQERPGFPPWDAFGGPAYEQPRWLVIVRDPSYVAARARAERFYQELLKIANTRIVQTVYGAISPRPPEQLDLDANHHTVLGVQVEALATPTDLFRRQLILDGATHFWPCDGLANGAVIANEFDAGNWFSFGSDQSAHVTPVAPLTREGFALTFDGDGTVPRARYVTALGPSGIVTASPFAIEAWIRVAPEMGAITFIPILTTAGAVHTFPTPNDYGRGFGLAFDLFSGDGYLPAWRTVDFFGDDQILRFGGNIAADVPVHVALSVIQSGFVQIFVNGINTDNTGVDPAALDGLLLTSLLNDGVIGNPFVTIDAVVYTPTAVSPTSIANHYRFGRPW